MKRIIIISGIIISGLFSSCQDSIDDFLTTPTKSSLDEAVIFSTPDLANAAIDGIKVPFTDTNSYRGRFLPWYGFNTDCEWYNSSDKVDEKTDLCVYDTKPGNSQMSTLDSKGAPNNFWASMYAGIERANVAIRGIRTYGNAAPGNRMGYLLGQALTLRAVYYADLLKTFGDVPARFQPITPETVYLEKSNRDIIYKQIIADLGEAATLVPWPNKGDATASVEQINRAFVKGFRARLALAASGYQQYPDGGGYGTVRRSTDPDLSVAKMYKLALDECRDVILSKSVSLTPSFETLWKDSNADVLDSNKEALWEIPFEDIRGRMLYTFAGKHNAKNQFQQMGSPGGSFGPLPNVFYDYDQKDTRRDVTCICYSYNGSVAKQTLTKLNTWYFGKYRFEWMASSRIPVSSANDDGVNKVYMRYAEVLLMAAETANELEGPDAAKPYLKEVRSRAFLPADRAVKVDAYVNALSSKGAMFDAIVDEHKFEFTGEMERKQALIRWNLLKIKLDDAKARMTRLAAHSDEYADVPLTLYYKYNAAPKDYELVIYGLNRGEMTDPGTGWTATDFSKLEAAKISSLYRLDPNTRQFWPIWTTFISTSNGKLKNDYNYTN